MHTHKHTHMGSHLLEGSSRELGANSHPGPHLSTVTRAEPSFWGHSQVVKHLHARSDGDYLS